MAESKTPEANYRGRTDIVLQNDTTLVKDTSGALQVSATAFAQHVAKQDAEVTAAEARAATAYGGAQSTGTTKRGKK